MTQDEVVAWFTKKVPDGWFTSAPTIGVDREEILVVGPLAAPKEGSSVALAKRFREETRDQRVAIADDAEHRFGRKVSWGVEVDGERYLFTHIAVPVMTRLRFGERQVLDTLIDGGVARSRSEALAWCVRLVEQNQKEWIGELRDALEHVQRARAAGPSI